jgi:predicted aspartyl protease
LILMLDSGANSLVLLPNASRALNLSVRQAGVETTSNGQLGLQVSQVRILTVGSTQFHDLPAALSSAVPAENIGDGLLPMSLFQSVYVDTREGFVILNPRARRR